METIEKTKKEIPLGAYLIGTDESGERTLINLYPKYPEMFSDGKKEKIRSEGKGKFTFFG
jgi:hypothetical protein